jgi:hypothetical protein
VERAQRARDALSPIGHGRVPAGMQQDRPGGENIKPPPPLYFPSVSPKTPADLQAALSERYQLRRVLGRGAFLYHVMPAGALP